MVGLGARPHRRAQQLEWESQGQVPVHGRHLRLWPPRSDQRVAINCLSVVQPLGRPRRTLGRYRGAAETGIRRTGVGAGRRSQLALQARAWTLGLLLGNITGPHHLVARSPRSVPQHGRGLLRVQSSTWRSCSGIFPGDGTRAWGRCQLTAACCGRSNSGIESVTTRHAPTTRPRYTWAVPGSGCVAGVHRDLGTHSAPCRHRSSGNGSVSSVDHLAVVRQRGCASHVCRSGDGSPARTSCYVEERRGWTWQCRQGSSRQVGRNPLARTCNPCRGKPRHLRRSRSCPPRGSCSPPKHCFGKMMQRVLDSATCTSHPKSSLMNPSGNQDAETA